MATEEGKRHVQSSSGNGVAAVANQLSALGDQNVIELLNVLEKAYSITYDREPEINRSKKSSKRRGRKKADE